MEDKINSLKTAYQYIDSLKSGINLSVENFQNNNRKEATEIVVQLAEGLEWLINVLTLTEDIQKEKIDVNKILENINSINEAFENEDYILISDILEYEILSILEEYQKCISISIK